jgi:transposase
LTLIKTLAQSDFGLNRVGDSRIGFVVIQSAGWVKPFSQDLRNRVIDAVRKDGTSCRAAARRYEVSESTAIKWLERYRRDGLRGPVGHGGHRPSALMPHREFLEAARSEKSDITLQALCDRLLSERGVKADTSMMSRFFRRIGVTLKKRPSSRANKTGRTSAGIGRAGEPISAASIPPPRLYRRDLGQNQHDPPLRLGAEGRAPYRQGPARPPEDRDLPPASTRPACSMAPSTASAFAPMSNSSSSRR